ncbi:MAG: DNA repair protein RadA [Lachnospiraceae bacterium]|nr:DNA repair protein RadA [Lachnospiraceae bacterium]
MKKKTTAFFCQECGYESAKWVGQCPACKAWNSMVEEPVKITPAGSSLSAAAYSGGLSAGLSGAGAGGGGRTLQPVPLSEVGDVSEKRMATGFAELDRVLGGGIVAGSMILVGGDPGIGKSTLLLQAARNLAEAGHSVLYVSGEESLHQIKLRAQRIGSIRDDLKFLCETDLDAIAQTLLAFKPEIVIIDSIQTMYNSSVQAAPGSVSQVRETTGILLRLAKETGITFFIIGHVTKEGTVAGPRVLEHMVDTVLYFEGDRYASYRILRGVKNRFGSTNEIGIFEMRQEGLAEVPNPSEYMLAGRPVGASGSVVTCSMEGTRPVLTEVQALVTKTAYGFAKRQAIGTDYNRVSLLMAVLEKRLNMPLSEYDAYVNLAGGIRQTEPALDLGIALAILSSYRNRPIDDTIIAFGEIGLSGEIRAVSMAEQRVQEAAKMGFKTCILPKSCLKNIKSTGGMQLIGVSGMKEVLEVL